jgi:uncharacterized protein (DUF1015 family)
LAKIAPFQGIRYNPAVVDADKVTSPPYDVISAADNDFLHGLSSKNFVRLILGRELPEDSDAENRFTRAAAYLGEWLADGTFVKDREPAIYVYEQHYTWKGEPKTVRGFVAAVKIEDYSANVVLPHENTLAKPKSHLAPLIRAVGANLDCVYALYPDPEHVVDAVLDRATAATPALEATDRQEVRHRLWVLTDKSEIETIQSTLADRQIVIADGHHRYETSLAYRNELREADGNPSEERPYDYVMMTLVNVYSPDVIVFPTHRMMRNLPADALDLLDAGLAAGFDLIESTKATLLADMEKHGGRGIGIYRPDRAYIAVPREGTVESVPGSPALKSLDLFVLHEIILAGVLGIDSEQIRQGGFVVYTRDENEAFNSVDSGDFELSFLLNPIKLEAILNVAKAGDRMPQKATYFYPKLLSGLVMRKIDR